MSKRIGKDISFHTIRWDMLMKVVYIFLGYISKISTDRLLHENDIGYSQVKIIKENGNFVIKVTCQDFFFFFC